MALPITPDAILVDVDGSVKNIEPRNGKKFQLEELYEILGCNYVERVSTYDGRIIICDEEGKLKPNYRVNVRASLLYVYGDHVQIAGKVIICKPKFF